MPSPWHLFPVQLITLAANPILIETEADLTIDLSDLERKAKATEARYLMLSHMRGHIADMDAITQICERHSLILIEDCAHYHGRQMEG